MDGRSTHGSERRHAVRLPAWFPAAVDRAREHDVWLVAHASQAVARRRAGVTRFRDEAGVFADLQEFAARLRMAFDRSAARRRHDG